ncbi:MAG: hypothetical protein J0L83_02610 [Chitinophagales bacterium]|nr:hypothetical protein [Chitinophagales bacterium]
MIKKIIENIPIITGLTLILGFIKINLYYQNWSLPIKYYLSISEIAISIWDDILFIILTYVASVYTQTVASKIVTSSNPKTSKAGSVLWGFFIVITSAILITWSLLEKQYYIQIRLSACIYLFAILAYATVINPESIKEFLTSNNDLSLVLLFFLTFLFSLTIKSSTEIKETISGKYYGTKIFTKDSLYTSNPSSYYIGQTDKFIFLYDTKGYTNIIPKSEVSKIEFYTKK